MKAKRYPKSPYLITSHRQGMQVEAFATPFRKGWLTVGLAACIIFPFIASPYLIHLVNLVLLACVGALALNLLTGNAGQLSLGHAGLLAAGAFTTAIMITEFSMPIWVIIPAVAIVGAILGLIAGLPSLRLKGIYLGLSTLAAYYIIYYLCSEYQYHAGFGYGIVLPNPSIGPFILSSDIVWYFTLLTITGLTTIFIINLLRSRPGRAWIAIHDRDIAAEVMGINISYYKLLAFVVSSSIAAVAGSLYAYYTSVASIDEYSFILSIKYLAMIIIGGMGSVLGSFLGAFLVTILPYALRYMSELLSMPMVVERYFFAVESGVFGLLIIVFLLVEPEGLVEIWRRLRVYFQLWPFRFSPLAVTKRKR